MGGCGLSDHYTRLPIPDFFKYDAPPSIDQGAPDVLAAAKAHGRTLFPHAPSRIEISLMPRGITTAPYTVCARVNNSSGQPTVVAVIQRSQFLERRRAEPQDSCDGLSFTAVDVD